MEGYNKITQNKPFNIPTPPLEISAKQKKYMQLPEKAPKTTTLKHQKQKANMALNKHRQLIATIITPCYIPQLT